MSNQNRSSDVCTYLIWFHAVAGESTFRLAPFHHTFGVFAFCNYPCDSIENKMKNKIQNLFAENCENYDMYSEVDLFKKAKEAVSLPKIL